ncbi:MAG: ribokinase [Candidatus Izemoplasmataceae bacterium]
MASIYVLGSINMDLVFEMDRLPKKGETIKGKGFMMNPGGKGANQAVAASLQGVTTRMVGSLGDDALSDTLETTLENYDVDTTDIKRIEDTPAGVAGILLEGGDNRIVIEAGANAVHDRKRIEDVLHAADRDAILIAQLEIPIAIVDHAFAVAKRLGLTTYLNAAPATEIPHTLFGNTDVLFVNESEAEVLSGLSVHSKKTALEAAEILIGKGAKSVLFTLGKEGALYVEHAMSHEAKGFTVDVRDTTAAGDTFIGVYAAKRSKGASIEEALNTANAAAALTVSKKGAQKAIPTRNEVQEFLKQMDSKENAQ